MSAVAACAIAGALITGCSHAQSDAGASRPVTDAGSTGLKEVHAAGVVAMGDAKHGGEIFSQNCSSCHGQAGAGGGIGPKLVGEKSKKNYEAAITWIKNPLPPMPKLYPAPLTEDDVNDVASYVETL